MAVRVSGRNVFHVKDINRSYRIRGRVARTHTNKVERNNVFVDSKISCLGLRGRLMNSTAVKSLIIRMLIYSAMKIRANLPPLNSVLNPETSSDSPSAKSNGVRLVSARVEINHMKAMVGRRMRVGSVVEETRWERSNVRGRKRAVIRSKLILTS